MAAGMDKPEQIARVAGVSTVMARRWLRSRDARISALHLAALSRALRVRMIWLATGESVPQVMGALTAEDIDALSIVSQLNERDRKLWLKAGKRKLPGNSGFAAKP